MARRRKKSKKPPAPVAPKVDKSLPALPPSAAQQPTTYTPDLDTPSDVFSEPTTTDVSPRPQHPSRSDSSPANFRRDASPASLEDSRKGNVAACSFQPPCLANLVHMQTTSPCLRAPTRRPIIRKRLTRVMTASCFHLRSTRTWRPVPRHLVNRPSLTASPAKQTRAGQSKGNQEETISIDLREVTGKCSKRTAHGLRQQRGIHRTTARTLHTRKRDGSRPRPQWTPFGRAKSPPMNPHRLAMTKLAVSMHRLRHLSLARPSNCKMSRRIKKQKQGKPLSPMCGHLRAAHLPSTLVV